ncbi:IS3 family transposase, partial [Streptomyces halstedii]|uniref:IS3 family transposase n=1 Tax=Streptomyces halstedii TaxID=1944 RepID=UPI0033594D01
ALRPVRSRRRCRKARRDRLGGGGRGGRRTGRAGRRKRGVHRGPPTPNRPVTACGGARPQRPGPAWDLIGRDFTADAPGRKLVGDITHIPTDEGWLYLATWLDLATREIVGYSMAGHHRASLVVSALTTAGGRGRPQPGCIAHSDRGSEYTSDEIRREMGGLGMRRSMGRTGSCFDNAAAEGFFALLKEEIGTRHWPDRTTAHAEIFAFIETFCNRRRLRKRPACGYLTPLEIRQRHEQEHALAA